MEADAAELRWEAGRWRLLSEGGGSGELGGVPFALGSGGGLDGRALGLLAPRMSYSPEDGWGLEQGGFLPLSPWLDLSPWAFGRSDGLAGGGLRLRRAPDLALAPAPTPDELSILIYRPPGGGLGLGAQGGLALRAPAWPALRVGGAWFSRAQGPHELRRGAQERLAPSTRSALLLEAGSPSASLEFGAVLWQRRAGAAEALLPLASYDARLPLGLLAGAWGELRAEALYAPREGEQAPGARLALDAGLGWERGWGGALSTRARVSARSLGELSEREVSVETTGNQTPRRERRAVAQQRASVSVGGGASSCAQGPASQGAWRHRACAQVAGFVTPLDDSFGGRAGAATGALGWVAPRWALHGRLSQGFGARLGLDLGVLWVEGLRGGEGWALAEGQPGGFARLGGRLRARLGGAGAWVADGELGPQEGWRVASGGARLELGEGGWSAGVGVLRRGAGLRLEQRAALSLEEAPSFLATPTARALAGLHARGRAPLWPGAPLGVEVEAVVPWEGGGVEAGWLDGRAGVYWGDEGWRVGVEVARRLWPEATDWMVLARSGGW